MVVVPLSKAARKASETRASTADSRRWVRMAAAGTLVASGVLLLAGKRRAGLVTALSGAALVMIEQREAVSKLWNALPGYLGAIESVAARAQAAVEDLTVQGERLRRVLSK
jgi:energy-converting hydrogenase Eha subunit B